MKVEEFALRIIFLTFFLSCSALASNDFWSIPRHGANFFNQVETKERLVAAKAAGIDYIRLAPNKWATQHRDFLLGNVDHFTRLIEEDFKAIEKVLDEAHACGLKVVLTTLSAPGRRWSQQNGDVYDKRIWRNFSYHMEFAEFWKQLADRLKSHPAIVGYDLLNEPAPERAILFQDWYTGDYAKWYASVKDTAGDINTLYRTLAQAIRNVDQKTPLILETGFYATPWAIKYLEKLDDPFVIYSMHMYEPYAYTNYEQTGEFIYPGKSPIGESENPPEVFWDRAQLVQFFAPILEWAKEKNVRSSQIFVGEFGVFRQHQGAAQYLADLISIFKDFGWHWAFYSFREDTWPGMDYELGAQALSEEWWNAYEAGLNPPRPYVQNPLFETIRAGL